MVAFEVSVGSQLQFNAIAFATPMQPRATIAAINLGFVHDKCIALSIILNIALVMNLIAAVKKEY